MVNLTLSLIFLVSFCPEDLKMFHHPAPIRSLQRPLNSTSSVTADNICTRFPTWWPSWFGMMPLLVGGRPTIFQKAFWMRWLLMARISVIVPIGGAWGSSRNFSSKALDRRLLPLLLVVRFIDVDNSADIGYGSWSVKKDHTLGVLYPLPCGLHSIRQQSYHWMLGLTMTEPPAEPPLGLSHDLPSTSKPYDRSGASGKTCLLSWTVYYFYRVLFYAGIDYGYIYF